nr:MAG TPA: hypothetical protein [Bacteriophage sp.]
MFLKPSRGLVQLESLLLASTTTCILYFHTSTDYILSVSY